VSTSVPTTLPPLWARFVDQVALGFDPAEVARGLGISNPVVSAGELLRHPQVRKALQAAAQVRLDSRAMPMAMDAIEKILADENAPAAVRAKLAVAVFDRAMPKAEKDQAPNPTDMSKDQLLQLVSQLQGLGVRPGEMLNVTPNAKGDAET
jgi:hypothetical protein